MRPNSRETVMILEKYAPKELTLDTTKNDMKNI